AAALADEAKRLALAHLKAHAVDRVDVADGAPDHAFLHRKMLLEVGDLEHRRAGHGAAPASRSECQQAAQWPGRFGSNSGYSARQRSSANGQRGANTQPTGNSLNGGTVPGISRNRPAASAGAPPMLASRGIEASRPCVYGCNGCSNSASTSASSTLRPAYITITRCAVSATTARSWVMRMMAVPNSCCSSSMRSR